MNSRSRLVGVLDRLILTVAALLILALLIALVSPPAPGSRRAAASAPQALATVFEYATTQSLRL
jgi:hypothetical protein